MPSESDAAEVTSNFSVMLLGHLELSQYYEIECLSSANKWEVARRGSLTLWQSSGDRMSIAGASCWQDTS